MDKNKIAADQIGESDDSGESSYSIMSNSGMDMKMMAEKIDKLEKELEKNQLGTKADLDEFEGHSNGKLEQKNEANLLEIHSNKMIVNLNKELWKLNRENAELREQIKEMTERKFEEQFKHRNRKWQNGELAEMTEEKSTDKCSAACNREFNCWNEEEKVVTESAAKAKNMKIAICEEQNPQPENSWEIANSESAIFDQNELIFPKFDANLDRNAALKRTLYLSFFGDKVKFTELFSDKIITGHDFALKEMQMSTVPMPDYLIAYTRISINSLDEQIIQFVEKIILPNIIGINLEIWLVDDKKEWQEDDARIPIIYRFLKMLAGKIFQICIVYEELDAFIRFFPGILDEIQCIPVCSKEPSNFQTIYNWLIKSRVDEKPKLVDFNGRLESAKHLIDLLREEFPRSTHPINFLVFMTLRCKCQFAEFKMENDKSGEELKLYKKVFGTGKVVHILARHKKGNNLWIKNYEDKMFVDAPSEIHIDLNLLKVAGFSADDENKQNSDLKQQNQRLAEDIEKEKSEIPVELIPEFDAKVSAAVKARMASLLDSLEREYIDKYTKTLKRNQWNIRHFGEHLDLVRANALGAVHAGFTCEWEVWNSVIAEIPFYPLKWALFTFKREYIAGYFEVRILNVKSSISIGFCDRKFILNHHRVGQFADSIGFHNDGEMSIDNKKMLCKKNRNFGYGSGDVVGSGLLFMPLNSAKQALMKMKYFNTINGELNHYIYLQPEFVDARLFPAVSLAHPGDSIKANFGAEDWLYDPNQLLNNN